MQLIKILIGFIFTTISLNIKSQCEPKVWSFNSGEKLQYEIVYNWSFIWVDAGVVQFEADKELLDGKQVYHFRGTGSSLKKRDWIFRVRDYFNSWADVNTLKPIKFSRNTSEGKYQVKNYYSFDYNAGLIYTDTWNSDKEREYSTIKMEPCVYDIMTAVYYARTLDFENFELNQKIPIKMIVDNKIYKLNGIFLGKEKLKTKSKKVVDCLKFGMELVEGTIFKGGEKLYVWVSDDENRVPVLVDAKILVGSVKALIKNTENLKVPGSY